MGALQAKVIERKLQPKNTQHSAPWLDQPHLHTHVQPPARAQTQFSNLRTNSLRLDSSYQKIKQNLNGNVNEPTYFQTIVQSRQRPQTNPQTPRSSQTTLQRGLHRYWDGQYFHVWKLNVHRNHRHSTHNSAYRSMLSTVTSPPVFRVLPIRLVTLPTSTDPPPLLRHIITGPDDIGKSFYWIIHTCNNSLANSLCRSRLDTRGMRSASSNSPWPFMVVPITSLVLGYLPSISDPRSTPYTFTKLTLQHKVT